jgi:hypothetical protein
LFATRAIDPKDTGEWPVRDNRKLTLAVQATKLFPHENHSENGTQG